LPQELRRRVVALGDARQKQVDLYPYYLTVVRADMKLVRM
jgi:hypothetical protein